jgi:hypothetical protein
MMIQKSKLKILFVISLSRVLNPLISNDAARCQMRDVLRALFKALYVIISHPALCKRHRILSREIFQSRHRVKSLFFEDSPFRSKIWRWKASRYSIIQKLLLFHCIISSFSQNCLQLCKNKRNKSSLWFNSFRCRASLFLFFQHWHAISRYFTKNVNYSLSTW